MQTLGRALFRTALRWSWPAALMGALLLMGSRLLPSAWLPDPRYRPDEQRVYKETDGQVLTLDVFRPPGAGNGEARPALILFHGGGWQVGSATQFHPQCREFSQRGMVCFAALYRTARPHGTLPEDALQDARDAIRFLRLHAGALGILPDRIVAGGGSAGGHLAAALGVQVSWPDNGHDSRNPTRPDALVLYNPMLDLSPGMPDHALVAANWRQLSPRHHITTGVPPTLILSGSADPEVAVATVDDFCRAVREAGGACDAKIHDGAGHGFFNKGVEADRYFDATNVEVAAFLSALGFLPGARR